jgi:DNA-binding NarL/FixJ family response regulator
MSATLTAERPASTGPKPANSDSTFGMIKIGIMEDNRDLRASLQRMVGAARGCSCIGAFSTAEEALKHLPALAPDVVLMDVHLPFRSGIECTRQLKELCPDTQVLILTDYEDSNTIFDALKAGASGYLLKRSTPAEILGAIREVREGGAPMSSQIARKVVASFREPCPGGAEKNLTQREREVLGYMTKGYSEKEIADKMHVSLNTVKTHRKHIYQKLHFRSRAEVLLKFQCKAESQASRAAAELTAHLPQTMDK